MSKAVLSILFSVIISLFFSSYLGLEKHSSYLENLKPTDSLTYYQCYYLEPKGQIIKTESGEELKMNSQGTTITEKFKLLKSNKQFRLLYYVSSETFYPNKKFAYLKLTEKAHWNFQLKKDTLLSREQVKRLVNYEKKLRSLTEYDFTVVKDNAPQVIINGKKVSEQFMVENKVLLRNLLQLNL